MKLSTFSDYSLRVLMYLAAQPDRLATIAGMARAYAISEAHLMKVIHQLGRAGFLETVRGKGGGVRLGRPAGEIVLGDVLRQTEGDFDLAECSLETKHCSLRSVCRLQGILDEGVRAMLLIFDGYTLADLVARPEEIVHAINFMPKPAAAG